VSGLSNLWNRLAGSKAYREALVASQLKRGLPFQARAMRKERGWSQALIAEKSGLTQGAVSRAEDPDYGNLTLNTVLRIAAGHDVAVICKLVSFSEFAKWYVKFSEASAVVPTFEEEAESFSAELVRRSVPAQNPRNWQSGQLRLPWAAELSGATQDNRRAPSSESGVGFTSALVVRQGLPAGARVQSLRGLGAEASPSSRTNYETSSNSFFIQEELAYAASNSRAS
jgi:transcriptional regulator with XRE-family HTH domain